MKSKQKGAMIIDLIFGCALSMGILLFFTEISIQLNKGREAHRQASRLAAGAAALESMMSKHNTSLAANGSAPGFVTALAPTEVDLRNNGFLPSYISTQMPYGGTMKFFIRVGVNKDLLGLACSDKSISSQGISGSRIAGQIMHASNGRGLRTTVATPNLLNGPGFQAIQSPILGEAIVCAWAALPTQ